MRPTRREHETHRLINKERKSRHIPPVKWDTYMHRLARNHSRKMEKAGRLFHSARPALAGGENCLMGTSSPKAIVKGWMSSPGHRSWILDPAVKRAAVGISNRGHGRGHHTYVAWSFSGSSTFRGKNIYIKYLITLMLFVIYLVEYISSSLIGELRQIRRMLKRIKRKV